jgi:glucose-6-phosphate isomerase
LIVFFEYTVATLAELFDVNAYDQPGVQAGKVAARRVLEAE